MMRAAWTALRPCRSPAARASHDSIEREGARASGAHDCFDLVPASRVACRLQRAVWHHLIHPLQHLVNLNVVVTQRYEEDPTALACDLSTRPGPHRVSSAGCGLTIARSAPEPMRVVIIGLTFFRSMLCLSRGRR
jgi:hypothetical protein